MAKLLFKLSTGRKIELTPKEAKELAEVLQELFDASPRFTVTPSVSVYPGAVSWGDVNGTQAMQPVTEK